MILFWAVMTVFGGSLLAVLWVFGIFAPVQARLMMARYRLCHRGCCANCEGTGVDASAPETNGRCWDCLGTGHCHP